MICLDLYVTGIGNCKDLEMIAMDEIGILKVIIVVIWRSEGKSR